jgi:hypothetical protein
MHRLITAIALAFAFATSAFAGNNNGATVDHTSTGMSVVTSAGPEHTTGQGGHDFVINYNNSGTHEIEQGKGTYFGGTNGQTVCTGVFAPCP